MSCALAVRLYCHQNSEYFCNIIAKYFREKKMVRAWWKEVCCFVRNQFFLVSTFIIGLKQATLNADLVISLRCDSVFLT